MFGLFRKSNKCTHFKPAGHPYPENMQTLIRFSEYKKSSMWHGIAQCKECGKRAFQCAYLHLMVTTVTDEIDKFINYEITLDQLLVVFDEFGYQYKLER